MISQGSSVNVVTMSCKIREMESRQDKTHVAAAKHPDWFWSSFNSKSAEGVRCLVVIKAATA